MKLQPRHAWILVPMLLPLGCMGISESHAPDSEPAAVSLNAPRPAAASPLRAPASAPAVVSRVAETAPSQAVPETEPASNTESDPAPPSPPTLTGVSPQPGSTGVSAEATINLTFSEEMDPSTISMATVYLFDPVSGTKVPTQVTYSNGIATLRPSPDLAPQTTFQVVVTTGIRSVEGVPLDSQASWEFTTE